MDCPLILSISKVADGLCMGVHGMAFRGSFNQNEALGYLSWTIDLAFFLGSSGPIP